MRLLGNGFGEGGVADGALLEDVLDERLTGLIGGPDEGAGRAVQEAHLERLHLPGIKSFRSDIFLKL